MVASRVRCTLKRVALLRFILRKGNRVTYSDLDEIIGKIVKSKVSLYETIRRNMKMGFIAINEYGEIYVTERGIEYLNKCKERGM